MTETEFKYGDSKWLEQPDHISKSQVKREMLALQALGEELLALSPAARQKLPLDEELMDALELADKLAKKREALRRHIQFIGRLMRDRDIEPIEQALAVIRNTNQAATRQFHKVETWRDRLIKDSEAVTDFIAEYPDIDVQQLRQLIRNAKKEQEKQQPPKYYRELFQLIKPLIITE
ncbi:ribosome biogenesis factor YjgA [Arsukibacterium sp.]|uniref:ribosome biogenesis factor YjgA n=1 Tax=Arsukibacterium sp. TaxID=1977258 RepID=UPI002FD9BC6E